MEGALFPCSKLVLEDLEAVHGISQHDPETWKKWRLSATGLDTSVVQDAGAWYVRARPGVRQAFAALWGDDLIVSMDAVLLWRPWMHHKAWRPQVEPLHLDQNPFHKPELEVVQGMVPLLPVTPETGGLQVVPKSHLREAKEALKEERLELKHQGDWCPLMFEHPEAQLLLAEAGDLLLWDARTVHGGVVGGGLDTAGLVRMAVTLAMVPRGWASEEVLKTRSLEFGARTWKLSGFPVCFELF